MEIACEFINIFFYSSHWCYHTQPEYTSINFVVHTGEIFYHGDWVFIYFYLLFFFPHEISPAKFPTWSVCFHSGHLFLHSPTPLSHSQCTFLLYLMIILCYFFLTFSGFQSMLGEHIFFFNLQQDLEAQAIVIFSVWMLHISFISLLFVILSSCLS